MGHAGMLAVRMRKNMGIVPYVKQIDTLSEYQARNYLYMTYNGCS